MAGSLAGAHVVPARMDHAMVTQLLKRLNDLSLLAQLTLVATIAAAALFWMKGAEGAA